MASPLILGNDLRNMSDATRNIIMNKDMIAIDQDTLGIQGLHYCDRDGLQFWFKPLAGGDWAFTILNPTRQDISCCLNWQDFNPLPPFFREDTYLAREVYLLRNISSIG